MKERAFDSSIFSEAGKLVYASTVPHQREKKIDDATAAAAAVAAAAAADDHSDVDTV